MYTSCKHSLQSIQLQCIQSSFRNSAADTAAVDSIRIDCRFLIEAVRIPAPAHHRRTRSHRRGVERCGCPHRIPGATHRQEAPDQTRRHAGTAHRQEAPAGVQRGVGGEVDWASCSASSGGLTASRDQLSIRRLLLSALRTTFMRQRNATLTFDPNTRHPKARYPAERIHRASLLGDGDVVFVDASEDDEGTSKHVVS